MVCWRSLSAILLLEFSTIFYDFPQLCLVRKRYEFMNTNFERKVIHLPSFHLQNILRVRRLRWLCLRDRGPILTLAFNVLQALKVQRIGCGLYVSSNIDHKKLILWSVWLQLVLVSFRNLVKLLPDCWNEEIQFIFLRYHLCDLIDVPLIRVNENLVISVFTIVIFELYGSL